MQILLILIGLALAVTANPIETNEILTTDIKPIAEESEYRLNEVTVPFHYDLDITPYFEDEGTGENLIKAFTFHGLVEITIKTEVAGRKSIRMHAKNLQIVSKSICKKEDPIACIDISSEGVNIDADILELFLETELEPNVFYIVKSEYWGSMDDDMHGFYKSSYVEGDRTVWLGATHLEATHARRVFLGFDEPQYKATYRLTLNIPKEMNAISNTEKVDETEISTDRKKIVFDVTPYMSSYLLVFIVSEFVYFENVDHPEFKVWSRPDQNNLASYASDVGPKILQTLSDYFDYDYYRMINKMDMAALPDFSAGAMENWGLLTYRETNQLYDENFTTDLTKQRIAAVIAHEQTHMWFGDLVGCQWWSYLWLNEGFARYYQYHGTAWTEKNWDLENQFPIEQVQTAMILDASENTHPMTGNVVTQAEASDIFDNISYNKGSSILRMFRFAMGDDAFRDALRAYLKAMSYKPSTPEDLFVHLNEFSYDGWRKEEMMPWTTQSGYPVIRVDVHADGKIVTVTQKRFLLKPNSNDKTRWTVPLTWVTKTGSFEEDTSPKHFLKTETETIEIDTTDSWVIFNVQESGFYRVDYDDNTWDEIKKLLEGDDGKNIHPVNRAAFIDDLMSFARAGERDYKFALDHIEFLEKEEHYLPWLSAFNSFSFLTSRLDNEALADFKTYLLKIIPHVFEKLGFERTAANRQIDVYNRANVINWACKAGHSACITKARELFNQYKDETNSVQINVNIRQAVYCSAIREGNMDDFNFLYSKFVSEEIATEKVIILSALGCARDSVIIEAYLDKLFKTTDVRLQDKRSAFTSTYTNTEENLDIVANYVYNNWEAIELSFGTRGDLITTFTGVAARFTKQSQIDLFKQTLLVDNADEFVANKATLERAVTSSESNLEWIEKNIGNLREYIDDYVDHEPDSAETNAISIATVLVVAVFTVIRNYF